MRPSDGALTIYIHVGRHYVLLHTFRGRGAMDDIDILTDQQSPDREYR